MQKWKKVSPSVDKLQKVADYFGVSMDFLLGRDVLSVQCQEIAHAVDKFPPAKQELVKKYITMLQAS
jgi:transcriptional regulator with XRE-family HTH domain